MGKSIVIIGSRGRLGSALAKRFSAQSGISAIALDRSSLSLESPSQIQNILSDIPFDLLINAAAMTNVDACEKDPEQAQRVNTDAPGDLAEICRKKSARMMHISTDYVFAGHSSGNRSEEEPTNPLGNYGKSKLAGEQRVLGISKDNLVIRTSWVFGSHRPSFPDMILSEAREKPTVSAISDKWSCPCYSEDFARWVGLLIERQDIHGTLHLCNTGACTWQEYGQETLDIAQSFGQNIIAKQVEPMPLASMKQFIAPRPIYSSLSCEKFIRLTGHTPRPWQEALRDYMGNLFLKQP